MLRLLADPGGRTREAAATALGGLRADPASLARMVGTVHDDGNYAVRRSALSAVIRLKPDHLTDLLTLIVDTDSPGQRIKPLAIATLARLGDAAIVPKLLDLSHDENDRVRRTALQAFGDVGLGQQMVVARLLEALEDQ